MSRFARIDTFIAEHRGNTGLAGTINALRLRKAVLLAVSGERNLALATFEAVDLNLAGNARDAALVECAEVLTWWWSAAGERGTKASFEAKAKPLVETLDTVINSAPEGSGIRYYLATMRAHIYLKWSSFEGDKRARLQEGLKAYAQEFDDEAQQGVKAWVTADARSGSRIPTDILRWYGHVMITFDEYDRVYREFLEAMQGADAQDLDPETRAVLEDILREGSPVWPPECGWIVELRAGAG